MQFHWKTRLKFVQKNKNVFLFSSKKGDKMLLRPALHSSKMLIHLVDFTKQKQDKVD